MTFGGDPLGQQNNLKGVEKQEKQRPYGIGGFTKNLIVFINELDLVLRQTISIVTTKIFN
ncbi:hypothetical protein D931_00156 [Enterococcus faecium 13.SD.W.09]|jgi:hypothetical protein|nr:hypothetical protein D931_00156 [Enterococcus faecium 13.SD.W.09]